MKLSLFWLISTGMLFASQTLTIDQQQTLKTYNHKPSQASTVEKRMKMFAKLSKSEAQNIAKPLCGKKPFNTSLKHQNAYLFYHIQGENCNVFVNAIDGTVIQEEQLND